MILAAGLGTRLGPLSEERPKPLLPVADIPLIRYAASLLVGSGIHELVVNLHHLGDSITDELGDGSGMGATITYSREQTILGTGGGIRHALPQLGEEPFVVMNGKIVLELDLGAVLAQHRRTGALATLVVKADAQARRWGAIDAPRHGGRIRQLLGDGDFMFTGVQVLSPELVRRLPDDGAARCIVRDGYVPWLAAKVPIDAYVMGGYFMEHSTPERYLEGNLNVLSGHVSLAHPPGPLVGVDPSAEVDPTARVLAPVCIGHGAHVGAGAVVGPAAVVGARAHIAPGVSVRHTVVWPDSRVETDAERCIITPRRRIDVPAPR
jgi:NDP-sugar pyrophosphorylase family protein